MITGTIKNTVNLAMMDMKWQQRKQEINSGKNTKELTAEESQIQMFQEQIDDMNENKGAAEIDAKLQTGKKLTQEEIEYLRKHNPQALKEYESLQQERKSYERQLRRCKTKEEVEKLQTNKMGECLSQMKKIANNPNIPKAAKLAEIKKILYRVAGFSVEHQEFLQTAEYAALPEDEKERKKRKGVSKEEERSEEPSEQSNGLLQSEPESAEDIREKIRLIASEVTGEKSQGQNTQEGEEKESVRKNTTDRTDTTSTSVDVRI